MTADLRRASASAEALRRNGYQVDLRGLLEGLRKGVIGVRAEAAFLLGQPPWGADTPAVDRSALVDALRRALRDEEARVRVEAARALWQVDAAAEVRDLLLAELGGDAFAGAPMRAAKALALMGDPSGWPRVLRSLQSALPSSRLEAVAVLPLFAPFDGLQVDGTVVDARAALHTCRDDPEPLVRAEAERVLASLDTSS